MHTTPVAPVAHVAHLARVTRAAFSLSEICVVMVILFLLIGIAMGLRSTGLREGPRKANCGNNQRQIILAMNVYANDNNQRWPVFTTNSAGRWVPTGDPLLDPTATALASLEFMTFTTGGDIPKKYFSCPANPTVRPTTEAGPISGTDSISSWAIQGPQNMGYSYDWSVPGNGSSIRVVTADRHTIAHRTIVMASFADGHVLNLNRSGTAFLNKNATGDDIYNDLDDGPMHIPNEGSTTRAFVR